MHLGGSTLSQILDKKNRVWDMFGKVVHWMYFLLLTHSSEFQRWLCSSMQKYGSHGRFLPETGLKPIDGRKLDYCHNCGLD